MIKLGIAGETQCYHARVIASLINGQQHSEVNQFAVFEKSKDINNIKIFAIYDRDQEDAHDLARDFNIPKIVDRLEQLPELVDGVLVLGGDRGSKGPGYYRSNFKNSEGRGSIIHHLVAEKLIPSGVPIYIDKPLAPTLAEATRILELADKHNCPVMSCSPRRFHPDYLDFKARLKERIGEMVGGIAYSNWLYKQMIFYGVHVMELLLLITGNGVRAVRDSGDFENRLIALEMVSGNRLTMAFHHNAPIASSLFFYGDRGTSHVQVAINPAFFIGLIKTICRMIEQRSSPISLKETLKAIEVLNAAEVSLQQQGKRIKLI